MSFTNSITTVFQDLFNFSLMDNVYTVPMLDMLIAILCSFAIGLFIFFVYKKSFKGVMYSFSFGISLIAMCMITTFVILPVTSNPAISLGMLGALSIIRFRTAIKEPLDISFLFWSLTAGIVIGAGMIPLGVIGSILIGAVLYFTANFKTKVTPYILVLNCDNSSAENDAFAIIKQNVDKSLVKSKTVSACGVEITFEVRLKSETTQFINSLLDVEGVNNAVLVSYNGEYMA